MLIPIWNVYFFSSISLDRRFWIRPGGTQWHQNKSIWWEWNDNVVRKFSGGAIYDRTHDNQNSHRKRTRARNPGGSIPTEGPTEKTSQKTETTKTSTENHFHLRLTTFHSVKRHLLFLFGINARKWREKTFPLRFHISNNFLFKGPRHDLKSNFYFLF